MKVCFADVGENAGETAVAPTEQQQGGGEVIENPDAPDNPDGYLTEEGVEGADGTGGPEAISTKV